MTPRKRMMPEGFALWRTVRDAWVAREARRIDELEFASVKS